MPAYTHLGDPGGVLAAGVRSLPETVGSAPPEQPAMRTDEELLELVALGNRSGLEGLYDRYSCSIFSLLLRMVGDREIMHELTQETFLRVWEQASSFTQDTKPCASWILLTAHRVGLDELRRNAASPRRVDNFPEGTRPLLAIVEEAAGPDKRSIASIPGEPVAISMAKLSYTEREVLELAYFGGLTQSEIAERTGESLGTVKTRMRQGLQRIRAHTEARAESMDLP